MVRVGSGAQNPFQTGGGTHSHEFSRIPAHSRSPTSAHEPYPPRTAPSVVGMSPGPVIHCSATQCKLWEAKHERAQHGRRMALHHRGRIRRSAVGRTSIQHTPRSRAVRTQQRKVARRLLCSALTYSATQGRASHSLSTAPSTNGRWRCIIAVGYGAQREVNPHSCPRESLLSRTQNVWWLVVHWVASSQALGCNAQDATASFPTRDPRSTHCHTVRRSFHECKGRHQKVAAMLADFCIAKRRAM